MKRGRLLLLIGLLFLWGCEPKPTLDKLVKSMVVTTDYNGNANFGNYSTYTMVLDTISYFDNSDPNPADTIATASQSTEVHDITSRVKAKMDSVGYSLVSKKSAPDLWVYIYVNEVYSAYQSYSYNPYSYGYYGGSYYPTVSVSDQADLYIYILDLKHKVSGPYLWAADIGDLVSSPDQTSATVVRAINQAFKQSPYIKK